MFLCWILKLLYSQQKWLCHNLSISWFLMLTQRDFYSNLLMWMRLGSTTFRQKSTWWKHAGSPAPKKAKSMMSSGKVIVSIFWGAEVLLVDFIEKSQTVICHANLLKQLQEEIKKNWHGSLALDLLFHQENVPPHKSAVALTAIQDFGFKLIEYPPYWPDFVP